MSQQTRGARPSGLLKTGTSAAALGSQISKFFPKSSGDDDDAVEAVATNTATTSRSRKRSVDVPSTSAAIEAGKFSLRENIDKNKAAGIAVSSAKSKNSLISKFFQPNDEDDDEDDDLDFQSPKKKRKTPTAVQPKKQTRVVKPKKAPVKSKTAAKNKNLIRERFFSDAMDAHSARDGVSSDDLQLALALSRSLEPAAGDKVEVSSASSSSSDVAAVAKYSKSAKENKAVHEIFQKFGFREGYKEYDPSDFASKPKTSRQRNRWTSKSTALTRRLPAVQEQKLRARVAHINKLFSVYTTTSTDVVTSADVGVYQMNSAYLARFYIPQRDLVELNDTADRRPLTAFYTNNLCDVSKVRAGFLLRNWAEIPGRDLSPERRHSSELPALSLSPESSEHNSEIAAVKVAECDPISDGIETASQADAAREPNVLDNLNELNAEQTDNDSAKPIPAHVFHRSASPDIFALSDSDDDEPLPLPQSAPSSCSSSDAACSLEPETISTSGTLPSPSSEEDRMIELYHKAAKMSHDSSLPPEPMSERLDSLGTGAVIDSLRLHCNGNSDGDGAPQMLPNHKGVEDIFVKQESSVSFVLNHNTIDLIGTDEEDILPIDRSDPHILPGISIMCTSDEAKISNSNADFPERTEQHENDSSDCDLSSETPGKIIELNPHPDNVQQQIIELSDNSEPLITEIIPPARDTFGQCSVDQIEFSFDSIASDLEASVNMPTNETDELRRRLLNKSIATNRRSISQSECDTDGQANEENVSLNALIQCIRQAGNDDGCIAISDDEGDKNASTKLIDETKSPNKTADNDVRQQSEGDIFIILSDDDNEVSIERIDKNLCVERENNVPTKSDETIERTFNYSFPSQEDDVMPLRDGDSPILMTKIPEGDDYNAGPVRENNVSNIVYQKERTFNYSFPNQEDGDALRVDDNIQLAHANDVSIEISDDDSNDGRRDDVSITNASLQQIFNDCDGDDNDCVSGFRNIADDANQLLDQSVRKIVREEFLANSSVRRSVGTSGRTSFRRYSSDVSGIAMKKSKIIEDICDDNCDGPYDEADEFDRMVHRNSLQMRPQKPPESKSTVSSKAKPAPKHTPDDGDQPFQVTHDGMVFDIKIGRAVSPKPDFEALDTPKRAAQLKRYGLKPLARRKAIICLEHIYNQLHPFVDCTELSDGMHLSRADFESHKSKQTLGDDARIGPASPKPGPSNCSEQLQPVELKLFDCKNSSTDTLPHDFFVYFFNHQSEFYLPSQPRAKRAWCLQPLHIAWHNLLADNPRLFEHVLEFRPINLAQVRTHFKELGMLFDANDLIAFFDKHCITFRTESARTKRLAVKKTGVKQMPSTQS